MANNIKDKPVTVESLKYVHDKLRSETMPNILPTITQGEHFSIQDYVPGSLRLSKIYGKSVRNGVPSENTTFPITHTKNISIDILGKNLIDSTKARDLAGNPCVLLENGYVLDAKDENTRQTFFKLPITLKKGHSYILSLEKEKISGKSDYVIFSLNKINQTFELNQCFTPTEDTDEISIFMEANRIPSKVNITNLQLELNYTNTNYEPLKSLQKITHNLKTELAGIPSTDGFNYCDELGNTWLCDEIDYINKKTTRKLGKITFTGDISENWQAQWDGIFYIPLSNILNIKDVRISTTIPNIYSDSFITLDYYLLSRTYIQEYEFSISVFNQHLYIRVNNSFNNVEQFKQYLQAHPTTVYYELKKPTDEVLDSSDIINLSNINLLTNTTFYSNMGLEVIGSKQINILELENEHPKDFTELNKYGHTFVTNDTENYIILYTNKPFPDCVFKFNSSILHYPRLNSEKPIINVYLNSKDNKSKISLDNRDGCIRFVKSFAQADKVTIVTNIREYSGFKSIFSIDGVNPIINSLDDLRKYKHTVNNKNKQCNVIFDTQKGCLVNGFFALDIFNFKETTYSFYFDDENNPSNKILTLEPKDQILPVVFINYYIASDGKLYIRIVNETRDVNVYKDLNTQEIVFDKNNVLPIVSPNALTFTGASSEVYDGSKPVTIDIPSVDTTLTQTGQAADAKIVGDKLIEKLNKNLGVGNVGKILKVGTDGNVSTDYIDYHDIKNNHVIYQSRLREEFPDTILKNDIVFHADMPDYSGKQVYLDGRPPYLSVKFKNKTDGAIKPVVFLNCCVGDICSYGRSGNTIVFTYYNDGRKIYIRFDNNGDYVSHEEYSLVRSGVRYTDNFPASQYTPTEDGNITTKRYVDGVVSPKLDKNLGTENAGKILEVGSDGNVVAANKQILPIEDIVKFGHTFEIVGNTVTHKKLTLKITGNSPECFFETNLKFMESIYVYIEKTNPNGVTEEYYAYTITSKDGGIVKIGKEKNETGKSFYYLKSSNGYILFNGHIENNFGEMFSKNNISNVISFGHIIDGYDKDYMLIIMMSGGSFSDWFEVPSKCKRFTICFSEDMFSSYPTSVKTLSLTDHKIFVSYDSITHKLFVHTNIFDLNATYDTVTKKLTENKITYSNNPLNCFLFKQPVSKNKLDVDFDNLNINEVNFDMYGSFNLWELDRVHDNLSIKEVYSIKYNQDTLVNIPASVNNVDYELKITEQNNIVNKQLVLKYGEAVSVIKYQQDSNVANSGKVVSVDTYSAYEEPTRRIELKNTDTNVALDSNKLYVFPEMSTITYTLNTPANSDIVNEYHFVFQSGATATQIVHPVGVKIGNFKIEPNKVYEVSIMENLLTSQSWAVV